MTIFKGKILRSCETIPRDQRVLKICFAEYQPFLKISKDFRLKFSGMIENVMHIAILIKDNLLLNYLKKKKEKNVNQSVGLFLLLTVTATTHWRCFVDTNTLKVYLNT